MLDNEVIPLASVCLLSLSPWHIQLTRASFESSFSVFWVVLALWLLLKAIHKRNHLFSIIYLLSSILAFAISIYTYNSARVFTPLFLIFLVWYFRDWILR